MVSRSPNSKNTVSDRNSDICILLIFENFVGINFRESPILKNFAGINFRESAFSGVEKGIYFREFGQISRNSRNFLPAKISSLNISISLVFEFHKNFTVDFAPQFLVMTLQ